MNTLIKQRLERLIPIIYNYLKQNSPSSGVMDFAKLGGEVINYIEAIQEIDYLDKPTYQEHLTYLISLAFKNGLPNFVLQQILLTIKQVNGYSNIAKSLYSKC